MQLTVEMAWVLAFAILLVVALLRTEAVRVLVPAGLVQRLGPRTQDEEDDQLPETDRAPRRSSHVLAYAVALTAAVRIGLLIAVHR